jgi:NAD-dependent SIR2 family protein deacetylase
MILPPQLNTDLEQRHVMLFAGAGLSAVLDLPNWSGLIAKMAVDLGFDPELFQMLGSYPSLAEYYFMLRPQRSDLADWLQNEWHQPSVDVSKSAIHRAMVEAKLPLIYTTNYDQWIEHAHEAQCVKFSKIVYGSDIHRICDDSVQIIKFHGDLLFPETMVVTESDYFERLRFETELDIKLRSDLLRYTVVFVGYSLTDVNMRNMLYRLSLFRKAYNVDPDILPRSYIFLDRQNEVETALFKKWGIDTIVSTNLNRSAGLEDFMVSLAAVASKL